MIEEFRTRKQNDILLNEDVILCNLSFQDAQKVGY